MDDYQQLWDSDSKDFVELETLFQEKNLERAPSALGATQEPSLKRRVVLQTLPSDQPESDQGCNKPEDIYS